MESPGMPTNDWPSCVEINCQTVSCPQAMSFSLGFDRIFRKQDEASSYDMIQVSWLVSGLARVYYFFIVRHASTKCRELWVILQLSVESVVAKVKYDNVTLNLNVIAEQILKCLRIRFFAIVVFVVFSCDCSLNSETAIKANATIAETRRKKVILSR